MLPNFSDEELTVPKTTILEVAEEISENLVEKINSRSESNLTEPS